MRVNSKKRSCVSVMIRVILICVLSNHVIAKDCDLLKTSTNNQLQEIGNDLVNVLTREQYELAIQKRYDKVEDLLQTAEYCLKSKKDKDWNAIKQKLTGLRSNARTLVFTKFENWMQVKEKDSALFKKPEVEKTTIKNNETYMQPLSPIGEKKVHVIENKQ